MNRFLTHLIAGFGLLGLAACGGGVSSNSSSGAGGASTGGMEMPVTLSVVNPETDYSNNTTTIPVAMTLGSNAVIAALNDPNTEFTVDSQKSWIHGGALEPMQQVNNILCLVNQLRTDAIVNQTYVALVDPSMCERQGEDSTSGDQSGGQSMQMLPFVVESTRQDNYSPQIVKAWVHVQGGTHEPANTIKLHITIYQGVSSTNPYGQFTLHFAGIATDPEWVNPDTGYKIVEGDITMQGSLETFRDGSSGGIGFTFFEEGNAWDSQSRATVVTDAAQANGYAHTGSRQYNWSLGTPEQSYYSVAFNPTHVLTLSHDPSDDQPLSYLDLTSVDGETEASTSGATYPAMCESRTEFDKHIWRYDLYHAKDGVDSLGRAYTAGQKVKVNSGFPFRFNDGIADQYGYVGYWGVWAENAPEGGWDLTQITKETYDGTVPGAPTHTVHQAPGKMIRKSKESLTLDASMDGEQFVYWECTVVAGCNEFLVEYTTDANLNMGTVRTVGTFPGFYKVATPNWGMQPPQTEITPAQVDTTNGLNMWSPTMRGSMYVEGLSPTFMIFYREDILNGNDPAFTGDILTLECFSACPQVGMTEAMYKDPWDTNPDDAEGPAYYYDALTGAYLSATYEYDRTTMKLYVTKVDGAAVTRAEVTAPPCLDVATCADGQPWGLHSGAMVDTNTGIISEAGAWKAAVSYTWETGHNDWNKLVYVTDNNAGDKQVSFQPPIEFAYTHSTANDSNYFNDAAGSPYAGKTFRVSYGGAGNFWGIPGEQGSDGRWVPMFGILDGTIVGANNEYAIKAREMELVPKTDGGQCGSLALGLPDTPLPIGSGTPDNIADPVPTLIDEAPKVISGELVDTDALASF